MQVHDCWVVNAGDMASCCNDSQSSIANMPCIKGCEADSNERLSINGLPVYCTAPGQGAQQPRQHHKHSRP